MADLSNDAKALAGAVWGSAMGQKCVLSYRRPHAIYPRTREALTELVKGGLISESRDHEGVHFARSGDCKQYVKFAMSHGDGVILSAMPEDGIKPPERRKAKRIAGGRHG